MNLFTGIIVFLLVWWTALFCVLPIGTRPDAEGDPATGGWRGAPVAHNLGWKILGTTLLAGVIWLGIWYLIQSDWISFRDGSWSHPAR